MLFNVVQGIPENKKGLGLITYAQCSNGTFLIRAAGCGHIITKVDGIPGLPEGKESIEILPKKIPSSIFWKTLEFFRFVESEHKGESLEAYVLVMFNKDTNNYFLYVPKQLVSTACVKYDLQEVKSLFPNSFIVMDIHSHGSCMGAFFSGTDNSDDNRDRYSAVIGKIKNIIPEAKVRFGTLGKFFDVDPTQIFFNSEEKTELNFDESIKNIIVRRATVDDSPKGVSVGKGNNNGRFLSKVTFPGIPTRSGYAGLFKEVKDKLTKNGSFTLDENI